MPATGSDFSAKSDETVLGFALAEFQLLQPLTEVQRSKNSHMGHFAMYSQLPVLSKHLHYKNTLQNNKIQVEM